MRIELDFLLTNHLRSISRKKHIKHAVMAVESLDGSFRWRGAQGVAFSNGEEMTKDTPYCIASVTKLYIATAIFKLQELGILSIQDPLSKHLPPDMINGLSIVKNIDHTDRITIKHLLGHSSGLPDYLEIPLENKKNLFETIIDEGDKWLTINDFLDIVRRNGTPYFPPQNMELRNKKIRYSDTNYQILRAIIEKTYGKPMNEVLDELIYKPLCIKNTFNSMTDMAKDNLRPAQLWYREKALEIPLALASFGDLYSTLDDQIVFMRALIKGTVFKDHSTSKAMQSDWNKFGFSVNTLGPGWPIEYALGMMRFKYPKFMSPAKHIPEIIGHTGVTGSWLFYCPELELIIAGDVSQVIASPLPFREVPRILGDIYSVFNRNLR